MDRAGAAVRRLSLALALCAALCAAAPVPTPASYFGHAMGADRTVLDWARVVSYFRVLETSSERLRLRELGASTEGRPFIAAIIASPRTLAGLDHYAWIGRKLADPRTTPEAEADTLIGQGKAVVMITCSIHSTEPASTASAVELAYRLLTRNDARTRAILDNTILLLVPSLNPDGVDLVSRWYRSTLGTAFEGTAPPELYHKYTGHDNNRDWYFFTQVETRLAVAGLHNAWHPQIVYDLHQQGAYSARMFVPPWIDPIDPNVDPILIQETNMIGTGIAADLTARGKTGVVVNALYDFWSPSRAYQAYHGGMRILSESASARLASPLKVRPDEMEAEDRGFSPRRASWNYPEPWLGGKWRQRDIVDYQLIAMESVLQQAAARREDLLRNFYRIGQRALQPRSPAAFLIPPAQHDPGAARV
ncbi:MAG TPA: M14 metallopeptidase family protein, partial [Bryobacteraceae bacterium]|nr:M14 metallopeptidase family protein [Bryobacteraceae bacterium]